MINPTIVASLGLTPVTQSMCHGMYVKINTEDNTPEAILEYASWWQDDKEKLNCLWWVLNYWSAQLDPDRRLRSRVEELLNTLARTDSDTP
ncbi:MAG: hypothetical protein HUK40_09910 [Desulfobacter sp.]|nr:hypothetical protein [Desulfobacter sp.]WDP84367.1 MAG: hypothetical protein HUN05_03725 [Desulfobacter sp.]